MPLEVLNKEQAKDKLKARLEDFKNNLRYYDQSSYKEGRVETEYIEPFFEFLGWDVRNLNGVSELYKDVIKRATVEVDGRAKEPDYSFTISGNPVFFVESKRPSESIYDNGMYSLQLRTYAYSAKIPISILTNFKEFAIYDCRIKPKKEDKASVSRIFYKKFEAYLESFDFIYDTFSRSAVVRGSLNSYVESKGQKGTSEVDDDFLIELEGWRERLAKSIAAMNKELKVDDLNFVIPRILNCILFLRIAEDKNIEQFEKLRSLTKSKNIFRELLTYFKATSDKYNSGLFDFETDNRIPSIKIDGKLLAEIIEELYFPNSPYDFRVLNIDILGSAYERFLGKTIRLTESHRVKIEDKHEVKKAGGIYYTPPFVVDYIIKNTIGRLVEHKSLKEIEKIRILDPACGSGTFLVRAYSFMLDWRLKYYLTDPQKYKSKVFQLTNGQWALTTEVRKSILLNNIFGVDIDQQAVELTKLSLLLKALENETKESVYRQLKLVNEKVLPNIDKNIRWGNSIVNHTYFNQATITENLDEQKKVNPFDWDSQDRGFGYLQVSPKFDVIIGNPPYVKEYTSRDPFKQVKRTDLKKYYQGKMDLWYIFTCKAIDLLKDKGLHSFIALNNWTTNFGASIMRDKILLETKLASFLDFNEYPIFKQRASNQTMIFVLEKILPKEPYKMKYSKLIDKSITKEELTSYLSNSITTNKIESFDYIVNPDLLKGKPITFTDSSLEKILTKIDNRANYHLSEKSVAQGIVSPQETVINSHLKYLDMEAELNDGIFVLTKDEVDNLKLKNDEKEIVKPYYSTDQLFRYYGNSRNTKWIIYSNVSVRKNINNFPNIRDHLNRFKKVMTSDFAPYGLHRARDQEFFGGEKVVSLRKTSQPFFTYTDFPCYVSQTYFILKPTDINLKYLTGLLNSNLIFFWLKYRGKKQGEQLQIDKEPLMALPLYNSKPEISAESELRIKIVDEVDNIIGLTKKLIVSESNKNIIEMQIRASEDRINDSVYELYGINNAEKELIESKLAGSQNTSKYMGITPDTIT